jgi:bifunctional lysine-specific demethylase and histidyl-hydroxylase MINA
VLFQDAQRLLGQFFSPLPLDEFLDATLSGGFVRLRVGDGFPRADLLGPDPAATLLNAYALASKLTFHSANPLGPAPNLQSVVDRTDFQQRIEQFHTRHYSVRFPELRPFAPQADLLARALEILLQQPVTISAFWSRGGMRAPVHFDDHDLIVVQLRGTKRWYVSKKPSELPNVWRGIPEGTPELGPHESFEVTPGDVVYLPRGTLHSVDSESESLHVSIGFTPLTVRDAIIAALDQFSDLDRNLRTTLGGRLASQLRGVGFERLRSPVLNGVARLLEACKSPGFLESAFQLRSSRTVARLDSLTPQSLESPVEMDTLLVHKEMAYCHLTANASKIDFSYPGGHLYIHRGAEESVVFIVNTPSFRARDIPGPIDRDARLALVGRFLEAGFLELAT